MQKIKVIRSPKHRRWIASLPCIICMREDVQCAHLRSGNGAGIGFKSGDNFVLPLCVDCHRDQHADGNEQRWWNARGGYKMAVTTANVLYAMTGDTEQALLELEGFRNDG